MAAAMAAGTDPSATIDAAGGRAQGPAATRRAPREEPGLLVRLGDEVFLARTVGILALAVLAWTVPAMGPDRELLAALLVGVALPYNLGLHLAMRRTGRIPTATVIADPLLSALFPAIDARAWIPTLVVITASTALAVTAFGRRRGVANIVVGAVALTAAGLTNLDAGTVTVGVASFVIAGGILDVTVGSIAAHERRLRRRYGELVSGLDAIVWEGDPATLAFTYVSDAVHRLLGFAPEQWRSPGFWIERIHPDDRDDVLAFCAQASSRSQDHELDHRMITADGRVRWFRHVVRLDVDEAGTPQRLRGVMFDVTEHKEAEEHVRHFANIVERTPLGVLTAQLDDGGALRLVAANPAASDLLGVQTGLLLGHRLDEAFPRLTADSLGDRLVAVAAGGQAFDVDALSSATPDPERVVALRAFPLPQRSVGIAIDDVTGASLATAALRRRAMHDDLTGLPNRTLLRDRLRQALHHSERTGEPVALMILDLDQFKEVNDALGHQYGDLLLIAVARRLQRIVREGDTIARLGGDEFALLLTTNADSTGAVRVADKVSAALQEPFEIEGMALQTNASIGIAVYPLHAETADALTQRADVAMYAAKRTGTRIALYAADDDKSSVARLTLLGEIRNAVDAGELGVLYQPVLDLRSGRIVGVEALVRWYHPAHGMIEPSDFIELAEVSGVIQSLTRTVIATAVGDVAAWQRAGFTIRASVNLSARNLYDSDLVPWVRGTLHRAGVPASSLGVELTESQLMDDMSLAMGVLSELRSVGVETAIDDFGTGYSSLAYLRELPINEIKIDRSFVREMARDHSDVTIVRSIVDLAHNLGLGVLAEGVEDDATLTVLRGLGCDRVQGYAIGHPMTAAAVLDLVRGSRTAVLSG
jgi:diguanylate cyclase (GGDEF)-like protein/PAS domain S-box-containing protein